MRKYAALILALAVFAFFHEGVHALVAAVYGEYRTFVIHPYGLEVVFQTPVAARAGIEWGFISGLSNIITVCLGYLLFFFRDKIAGSASAFFRAAGCYLTVFFLLIDPLNLSVGPFLYGGDIGGITAGFGFNQYFVQAVFFSIFLLNRELMAARLLPAYGVETTHPLFRRWFSLKET